jgi:hypothetical protein
MHISETNMILNMVIGCGFFFIFQLDSSLLYYIYILFLLFCERSIIQIYVFTLKTCLVLYTLYIVYVCGVFKKYRTLFFPV